MLPTLSYQLLLRWFISVLSFLQLWMTVLTVVQCCQSLKRGFITQLRL